MKRKFNITGFCNRKKHYMVKLEERLKRIKEEYVDEECYFIINRGRQYGKTTTLRALADYLKDDYIVLSMDFQIMSTANFVDEQTFVTKFVSYMETLFSDEELLMKEIDGTDFSSLISLKNQDNNSLDILFKLISRMCKTARKPIVLMIDEVDSASNNQVFIDFLAQLRGYYLDRERRPIFQSVILAGVYDIKNLKQKIRPDIEHQYNSPWNIAADFKIHMSFSADQIAVMLEEYEEDHQTGMRVTEIAKEIYRYTSGYPYLVSAICKYLDEEIPEQKGFDNPANVWTTEGIAEAVKLLLNANIPLFGSMMRHINEYPDLRKLLYVMLFQGERVAYNPDNRTIELARMFGYVVNQHGMVQVANRIFETRLYNLFLSEEELESAMSKMAKQDQNQFIVEGKLNMEWVLRKFVEYFHDIYGENDEKFVEAYGRKFFLLYLKPIINGTGNYYIEAQTRDAKRTDIVVDYLGEQFVIELKIWRGNEYNERGEQQLAEYLDYFRQEKGYLISFNFNKKKEIGVKELRIDGKMIIEAVV